MLDLEDVLLSLLITGEHHPVHPQRFKLTAAGILIDLEESTCDLSCYRV